MLLTPHRIGLLAAALLAGASVACETPPKPAPGAAVASAAIASAAVASARAAVPPTAPSAAAPGAADTGAAASSAVEPDEIAAQHVLIAYRGAKNAPREVKRSKAEARKLAEEVVAKARARTEFAKLAEQYSDDPGTKTNLGNLGKFPKDKMVPEFAGPAFKLRDGEISDVVETPFGFHVIKRNQ